MHVIVLFYTVPLSVVLWTLYSTYRAAFDPLRHIPGPFWARFSRLWYAKAIVRERFEHENIALHRKYASAGSGQTMAPFVRIGPGMYSMATPEKTVYGIGSPMPKSDWYMTFNNPAAESENLFSERNNHAHGQQRKRMQALYSLSSLLQYEGFVNESIGLYKTRLNEFARSGKSFDLARWMQYYAFDVIGSITYGRRFGFLDEGRDVNNMIPALHQTLPHATILGLFPQFYRIVIAILVSFPGSSGQGLSQMFSVIAKQLSKRLDQRAVWEKEGKGVEQNDDVPMDMLDRMLNAMAKSGKDEVSKDALVMSSQNVMAGSDTTSISLSSCMYNLLRTPSTLAKLRSELDEAVRDGVLTEGGITFKQTQQLPYLQACIKEALRIHPATGLPMWRVVPTGGAVICNQHFPAGSEVGINSWVVHYNQDIWGPDADEFRPERWIEASDDEKKNMEANWVPFGLGSRTCSGRHISYLEMCKLLPVVVNEYDFELEEPHKPWKTANWWFVMQKDWMVTVKKRATIGGSSNA